MARSGCTASMLIAVVVAVVVVVVVVRLGVQRGGGRRLRLRLNGLREPGYWLHDEFGGRAGAGYLV